MSDPGDSKEAEIYTASDWTASVGMGEFDDDSNEEEGNSVPDAD